MSTIVYRLSWGLLALVVLVLVVGVVCCSFDTAAAAKKTPAVAAAAPAPATSAPPCTDCTERSPATCSGICLVDNPLLIASDTGVAKGTIRVCNKGSANQPFELALSAFHIPSAGGTYKFGATGTLASVDEGDRLFFPGPKEMTPRCIRVAVDASGLVQSGVMVAELTNRGELLGELRAVRRQVPFDLKVEGANPNEVSVTIVRDEKSRITLRNGDPIQYRFAWRLELGGEPLTGTAEVGPGRLVDIDFDAYRRRFARPEEKETGGTATACRWLGCLRPEEGFWQNGFLRGGRHEGRLLLQHLPDPSYDGRPTAEKKITVQAQFAHFTSDRQRFWNAFFVFVVVLLGIGTSLGISYALPMMRKRYAIKQRLAEQDGRLGGMGGVVASRTLNLLRVEKRRLREELHSWWVVDPETEAALQKLETRVAQLGRRIEFAARAGELLKAVEGDAQLAQYEVDEAARHGRLVLALTELPSPTEPEFGRMQSGLDAAAAVRALRDQAPDPVRVDALAARAKAAGQDPEFKDGQPDTWAPFAAYLDGLRRLFLKGDEKAPNRERFVDAADAVTRAEAILRYAQLIDTAGATQLRRDRLARADDLLKALPPGRDASAPGASELLDEIEQNVGAAAIAEALRDAKPGDLRIEVDPPRPWPYQLVVFRVHHAARGFDEASAREKIDWAWRVSSEAEPLQGNGWSTCHFFEREVTGEITVTASAVDPADPAKLLFDAPPQKFRLEKAKTYMGQLTLLATFSLAITILVVGFGLIATAQEKLQALDWLAGVGVVFGVGFAADVLRRVLGRPA